MNLNFDTAVGHARALAHNYRAGNPSASDALLLDYVATEMVNFVERARNAHDLPTDYDAWYAHATLNFGSNR